MAKTRIDPKLPSSKLTAAVMAQQQFFEFMYAIVRNTNAAKVFKSLYDTADAHPEGLSVGDTALKSTLDHSMASQALIQLKKKKFIVRERRGQEVYSWVNPVYITYFGDFVTKHQAKMEATKDLPAPSSEGRRARG